MSFADKPACMDWKISTENQSSDWFITWNYSDNVQKSSKSQHRGKEFRGSRIWNVAFWLSLAHICSVTVQKVPDFSIFSPVHMYSAFLLSFLLGFHVSSTVLTKWKSVFNDLFYPWSDQTLDRLAAELRSAKLRTTTNGHIITSSLSLTSPSWGFSSWNSVLYDSELLLVGQRRFFYLDLNY